MKVQHVYTKPFHYKIYIQLTILRGWVVTVYNSQYYVYKLINIVLQTYMQLGLAEVNHLVNYYWAMMDSDLEQVMFGTLFASFTP